MLVTSNDPRRPDDPLSLRAARTEAFSDGVFAIAITLLVLEISVPSGREDDLLKAVLGQWPSYLTYLVSFSTIGAIWLTHTTVTEYLARVDTVFIRLNLLLLLVVSFIPFPTRLLAEYTDADHGGRVSATLYGITLLLAASLVSLLWRYAVRERLVHFETTDEDVDLLTKRLTPGLALYPGVLLLGLFLPVAALFGYLALAVFFVIPLRPRWPARWRRLLGSR